MASEWLPFGVLGRTHGTKGEILLRPYNTGSAGHREFVLPSLVQLPARALQVASSKPVPGGFLVRFAGVADRQSATALVGQEVHIPRRSLAPLGAAEFFVEDIVGCEVVGASGQVLGQVRGTYWNGAQDVMVIAGEDGGERLVPVVAEYVLAFDGTRRRLRVDPHD